jgi:hypothetical protein
VASAPHHQPRGRVNPAGAAYGVVSEVALLPLFATPLLGTSRYEAA